MELLDVLSELFDNFSYEIVPDNALPPETHAETDILTGHITIKESVYERACKGAGQDRMTVAHEIGHFFTICCCGFKMQRIFTNRKVKAYNDPEWQAKCFAGEFLIDHDLTRDLSPFEIVDECGVTLNAAWYQSRIRGKRGW
ncbi:MAG: peptidase [Abditibacteriota bacterium]|nr:peptidase [Abditibacteriota bacterium]